jgi:nitrate/TMAO reductase-like tetraheme cytochrome c subunit
MDLKKKPASLYIPIDPTYTKKIKSIFEGKSIMKFQERMKRFFFPAPDSPRWILLLPYITLIVVGLLIAFGGIHTWEYTNSNEFCGTACHTMPPQSIVFEESPHSNVTCEECHIGRASFFDQAMRKTQGLKEAYYQIFNLYEYPIRAKALRPSVETCEKCHRPETFADDSLRLFHRFEDDSLNTATTEYIIMKTGGGDARTGEAQGIHWHIANKVMYYSADELGQEIPYVRVYNDDGTYTEYVDVESGFRPDGFNESHLKPMDCITCHNRVTHEFMFPSDAVDLAMSRGLIDPSIPMIHEKAVTVLQGTYETRESAMNAIAAIEEDYKQNHVDYYGENGQKIDQAVAEIQAIYDRTVFHDQKVDPTTHPNNLGHMNSPGCFRCHGGTHLNAENEAIRLECNLCHSIPVVAGAQDFLINIEISRGPEPESHLNSNWINLHNQAVGPSCSNCHSVSDPGGTSNTSFCSNSACHGNVFTFAGFDAPALREILKTQLPPPEPAIEIPTLTGDPTFDNYIGVLFAVKCTGCHTEGDTAPDGLDLSSYAASMEGSDNGAVIMPGNAEGSVLIQVQSGAHFKTFTSDELEIMKQWINLGAPR